jgi:hypothetical protein
MDRGSRVEYCDGGSTQTVMEYQINADHDGVPEEDKYAKDTKARDHSVNAGGVTVEMVNNAHLDGKSIQRSVYKLRFGLQWSHRG